MFHPERIWYGFPGTKEFNGGSFMWGFVICLTSNIILLQMILPNPGEAFGRGCMTMDFPVMPSGTGQAGGGSQPVLPATLASPATLAAPATLATPAPSEGPATADSCSWNPGPRLADDPWDSIKLSPKVSPCLVAGLTIEELDPETNFRRSYALGASDDLGDRTHLLPYLRAARDPSLHLRKRRVLIDLGAGQWPNGSTEWFSRYYPLDFTEVHAFESSGSFIVPSPAADTGLQPLDATSRRVPMNAGPAPVPALQLSRVTPHQQMPTSLDDPAGTVVNVTRYMKEHLALTADDAVVVKMTVKGFEWEILPGWVTDPAMAAIVDELFVEMHYQHPSMSKLGGDEFGHYRGDAVVLLTQLRAAGIYAHVWP